MQRRGTECLSWIRQAEEAFRKAEYEVAASHLRRVTAYLWGTRDLELYPRYTRRLCDCYLAAAHAEKARGDLVRAAVMYRAAVTYLRELGEESEAAECKAFVDGFYESLLRSGFAGVKATPRELKSIGDYLKASEKPLDAAQCYLKAAKSAFQESKWLLAAGLFRDAGDAYRATGETGHAVEHYEEAAELYARSGAGFETAWYLTLASFMRTSLGDRAQAEALARRAMQVSAEAQIPVLVNELASAARLLARGQREEARDQWNLAKRKLRPSYASVVEKSFEQASRPEASG